MEYIFKFNGYWIIFAEMSARRSVFLRISAEALRKILTPQVQQVSSPLQAILRAFERKKKTVLRDRTLGRNGLWDLDGPIWTGTVNKKTRADPENVVYVCTYPYIYICV